MDIKLESNKEEKVVEKGNIGKAAPEDLAHADYRFGHPIDKGAVLTTDIVIKNQTLFEQYCDLFLSYPDLFIDLITPKESNFKLFFYQRIFLRANLRYRYHFATFTRAFSKSFLSILGLFLRCIFLPGSKVFLCADVKAQGVKIAREKINEILGLFPILENELISKNMSVDYVSLTFKNGSIFDVVGIANSTRGGRRHAGLIEEVATIGDGDTLNETVIPLMNINRRTKAGVMFEKEPHQSQCYVTTAGTKSTFAYEKLKDLLVMSVMFPHSAFVWGGDYRIPIMHGLLSKDYIRELRLSPTYKADSFAREYLSIWSGGSPDSWINYDNLTKYRKIVNAEKVAKKVVGNTETFYIISVDVARITDQAQSVACIFKVFPREKFFVKKLVNIHVHTGDMHFGSQAMGIKRLIRDFQPREVIIDGNGLGVGLLDFMTIENVDPATGEIFPPYGSYNDKELMLSQPKDCEKIIYVMKANERINAECHSNCFTQISSGRVAFLIREQEAKEKLMATKRGQKLPLDQKVARILPHELTTRLFEEMCNLRPKQGSEGLKLERINSRTPKDKFSAFEYGLWLIKGMEEKYYKNKKRHNSMADYVFYTDRKKKSRR